MREMTAALCGLALLLTTAGTAAAQAPGSAAPDGAELYKRSCAQCHDAGVGRAPNREQYESGWLGNADRLFIQIRPRVMAICSQLQYIDTNDA